MFIPPAHPGAYPFECKHEMQKMDEITDVSGKKFMLAKCCRCRMEFVYRIDEDRKMTKVYEQPAEDWIN